MHFSTDYLSLFYFFSVKRLQGGLNDDVIVISTVLLIVSQDLENCCLKIT